MGEELECKAALRHAFLGICGAIMVRNLEVDEDLGERLPDTFCEVRIAGKLLYRSGVMQQSVNPTWVLRSRVRSTSWPVHVNYLKGEDMAEVLLAPGTKFDLLVFRVLGKGLLDAFPYHHSGRVDRARVKQLFSRSFSFAQLSYTGFVSEEVAKAGSLPTNHIFFGLHHKALPFEEAIMNGSGLDKLGHRLVGEESQGRSGGDSGLQLFLWESNDTLRNETQAESLLADSDESERYGDAERGSGITPNIVKNMVGEKMYDELLILAGRIAGAMVKTRAAEQESLELLRQQVTQASRNREGQDWSRRMNLLTERKQELEKEKLELLQQIKLRTIKKQERLERLESAKKTFELLLKKSDAGQEDDEICSDQFAESRVEQKDRAEPQLREWFRAESDLLHTALCRYRKELCLLRGHRINLLRSLAMIYPLQERFLEGNKPEFYIRGIPLPISALRTPSFGSNQEEQVATALGYLAHLVQLMAKYLNISLRYVPLPHSSSSTICDPLVVCRETPYEPMSRHHIAFNGATSNFPQYIFGSASGRLKSVIARRALSLGTYPLYWKGLAKNQRSQFSLAVELLDRNVELLAFLHSMSSDFPRKEHIHLRLSTVAAANFDSDLHVAHMIDRIRKILANF